VKVERRLKQEFSDLDFAQFRPVCIERQRGFLGSRGKIRWKDDLESWRRG
jgi:hypothetical protein